MRAISNTIKFRRLRLAFSTSTYGVVYKVERLVHPTVAGSALLDLIDLGVGADRSGGSCCVARVDDWLQDVVPHGSGVIHRVAVVDSVGQVITKGPLIAGLSCTKLA